MVLTVIHASSFKHNGRTCNRTDSQTHIHFPLLWNESLTQIKMAVAVRSRWFVCCFVPSDQDTEHADVPNGNADEPLVDGEEMTVAVTRKTKKKR